MGSSPVVSMRFSFAAGDGQFFAPRNSVFFGNGLLSFRHGAIPKVGEGAAGSKPFVCGLPKNLSQFSFRKNVRKLRPASRRHRVGFRRRKPSNRFVPNWRIFRSEFGR